MKASEIRQQFLDFFEARGHAVRPSSSLVPGDDPTLLFTNAGMVPFKTVFLGVESLPFRRAVTAQKCVRAGGKHNDLEQVGETARHHTFFEMLGNFSFGDYFKREAVAYAWEFLTGTLGLDPLRLYVTVHESDDEAEALWQEVAGVPLERIFRLGDRDNFWQMADTGPCGPCSELHYDLRPLAQREAGPVTRDLFVEAGERGEFLELWNLVFMQYDRDVHGTLNPLPAPSIDTGAGLERITAVLQGADSNYHTDLFLPLLERVGEVVGRPYAAASPEGMSYRVLADHARAVAFLLTDGVFPSNEGRGYVLRRILRRAVRHAWLLGRREPSLVHVVEVVLETMATAYPELAQRREHVMTTTRQEEERFLSTIEGGLSRFDELAPRVEEAGAEGSPPVIPGEEAFKLYDTFGFPLDLTQIMARERGYAVDVDAFENALEEQRARSRADRAASGIHVDGSEGLDGWSLLDPDAVQNWRGWEDRVLESDVLAFRVEDGRGGVILRDNPFYLEAGGQVSDTGRVVGEGWLLEVEAVRKVDRFTALFGRFHGEPVSQGATLRARTEIGHERHDTERNHTTTHLLHAALREILGPHVTQRGSLVSPDRLRFDFSHPRPVSREELEALEARVNAWIWEDHPVGWETVAYPEAVGRGAMALFGEKYGDVVRVVEIPGVSLELCGGTHLRHTGEAGVFTILREGGVASGVRRIEAATGPGAYRALRAAGHELDSLARTLKVTPDALPRRIEQLLREKEELSGLVEELRSGGGAGETVVVDEPLEVAGEVRGRYRGVKLVARDAEDARGYGDGFLASGASGVLVVAVEFPGDRRTLFAFVTDDLIGRGVRADALVREVAQVVGGRGGGRPHMAQAGIEDATRIHEALQAGRAVAARLAGALSG
jgi:alanyl-tRNA synthetase